MNGQTYRPVRKDYLKHIMKPRLLTILIALCALLTACASVPATDNPGAEASAPQPAPEKAVKKEPPADARPTPPEVMFHVFAGEVAGQHEDYSAAAKHYLNAARLSKDPAIAQLATQIALFAGEQQMARDAVARLLELSPQSARAHRTAAALALQYDQPEQAGVHLKRVIGLNQQDPGRAWLGIVQLLSQQENQALALDVMAQLAGSFPKNYHAAYAASLLAQHSGKTELAFQKADRALQLNPDWAQGYSWRGQIKANAGDYVAAVQDFERALELEPEQPEYRYHLAEAQRRAGDFDAAQATLAELPESPALLRTRAALALEAEDWALSQSFYRELLALEGYKQEARYFLGQLAEVQEHFEESLQWYEKVVGDRYRADARIREAVVLRELGRTEEALARLDALIAQGGDVGVEAIIAKAQFLVEKGQVAKAFGLYDQALTDRPDSTRLLYARGILAAEQDQVSRAEQDFRAILTREPDNAMTLNALGYTLANQTQRYEEALELISRALELTPEDPAVVDSMGWVQYRLGNYQAAEKHLRHALDLHFDAEVASHLGEVLWVSGQQEAARAVWQNALEQRPEQSETVHQTMERLTQ